MYNSSLLYGVRVSYGLVYSSTGSKDNVLVRNGPSYRGGYGRSIPRLEGFNLSVAGLNILEDEVIRGLIYYLVKV